jgi:hypothetical protein
MMYRTRAEVDQAHTEELAYYSMEIDEHQIWCGHSNGEGYGLIQVGALYVGAHRLAWELANGPIPPGMIICHKNSCHHPACINPDHLYCGTPQDNRLDMVAYESQRFAELVAGHPEWEADRVALDQQQKADKRRDGPQEAQPTGPYLW